jgi:spore maturation protein B
MNELSNYFIPGLLGAVCIWALYKRVDLFSALLAGAQSGMKTVVQIFPALICLLPAVYMLRASGLLDALANFFSPLLQFLGLPSETVPLMLLRPISGSGALALGSDLIQQFGPDSLTGRIVAVMLGSTETTFYVIATYFGAAGIKKTRHAVPSALVADLTGFLMAAFLCRLLWA